MSVFGTRPWAIKMCPLVKEFQKHSNEFETIVCVTGQHCEHCEMPDYYMSQAEKNAVNRLKNHVRQAQYYRQMG